MSIYLLSTVSMSTDKTIVETWQSIHNQLQCSDKVIRRSITSYIYGTVKTATDQINVGGKLLA